MTLHGRKNNRRIFSPVVFALFSVLALSGVAFGAPDGIANMINNFDFSRGIDENDLPIGWRLLGKTVEGNMEAVVTDEIASVGNYSLKVTDTVPNGTDAYIGILTDYFDAVPGQEYRVEVDVLIESGIPNLELEWRSADNTKGSFVATPDETKPGVWQRISLDVVIPDEAVRFKVHLYSPTKNVGVAYFDNVLLYRVK